MMIVQNIDWDNGEGGRIFRASHRRPAALFPPRPPNPKEFPP